MMATLSISLSRGGPLIKLLAFGRVAEPAFYIVMGWSGVRYAFTLAFIRLSVLSVRVPSRVSLLHLVCSRPLCFVPN